MERGYVFTRVCHSVRRRRGGLPSEGMGVWSEGVGVWSEGVGVWTEGLSGQRGGGGRTPPPEMATAAVGTHPIGMHFLLI